MNNDLELYGYLFRTGGNGMNCAVRRPGFEPLVNPKAVTKRVACTTCPTNGRPCARCLGTKFVTVPA